MRPELENTVREIEKVISGKRGPVVRILTAMLANGHVLLDDVPGVGKTTLAVAIGRSTGLSYRRIQFTPDVLPSDITGFSLYDREKGGFSFRPGAVLGANLVLGDEINRASSRTQSALLEAMEERQVTVDGEAHKTEDPFCVIATENSVGTAGTQALPYAQMDRFLVRLSLGYPDHEAQMAMLRERRTGDPMERVERVLSRERFREMQREALLVRSDDAILDYISRLSEASRAHAQAELGISPRGALYLDRMAKANAYALGRDYVTGQDVQDVFFDVCSHRLLPKEGTRARDVLADLLRTVRVPDIAPSRRGAK